MLDTKALLAAYDSQLRGRDDIEVIGGAIVERDGPLVRHAGGPTGGFVDYRDLGGLEGAALDELIARQRDFFAARGEKFEWKTRAHDLPPDLPQRLAAHGFEPEELETVVIGLAAGLAAGLAGGLANPEPKLPPGLVLRETTSDEDFERIAELNTVVWGEDLCWLAGTLRADAAAGQTKVYVVSSGQTVVSAAWIRFMPGTDFAGLWGGATLEEFRGRGIYKALVAVRAADAVARGHTYLQVDASDDSRPILERLGFVAVTTTTPYIWKPAPTS
ncbi:MAG TPA: GNAT family N-acetyltransferase [Candidatus Limnocylindrales bacterium]